MGKAIDLAFDKVYVNDSPELKTATYKFWLDIGLMGGLTLVSAIAEFFFEYLANVYLNSSSKILETQSLKS